MKRLIQRFSADYTYQPLKPGHIRLLHIISSSDDKLKFKISQFPIVSAPGYHAISYAWGTDPITQVISCNGRRVLIARNLLEGLLSIHRLFGSEPKLWLWVDALCIRQDNTDEKSAHVQQMYQIFGNALKVYIWLGVAADNSDLFMQRLAQYALDFRKDDVSKVTFTGSGNKTLVRLGLPPAGDQFWTAYGALISRSWFRRLWILQEIMDDREAVIICGDHACNFEDFHALYRRIYPIGIPWLIPGLPDGVSRHFSKIFNARSPSKRSIALLYTQCGNRDCLEPLDRVYGLLGLMPAEYREAVKVDYSEEAKKTYWNVWLDAFKITILYENNLRFFDKLPSREPLTQLPSWAPNIASWSEETAPLTECRKPPGLSTAHKSESRYIYFDRKFSALPEDPNRGPEISFPEERTLRALGIHVDEVATVIAYRPLMSWPAKLYDRLPIPETHKMHESVIWLQECYNTAVETSRAHGYELDMETFARTLICFKETTKGDELTNFACAPVYKVMYNCLTHPEDHIPEEELVDEATLDWYAYRLASVQDYRVFFTTKGGRIGVGNHRIQPGDTLTIFFGAIACYGLRKREVEEDLKGEAVTELNGEAPINDTSDNTNDQARENSNATNGTSNGHNSGLNQYEILPYSGAKWQFICPAYVSGLMASQVYKLLRKGKVKREFFDIT